MECYSAIKIRKFCHFFDNMMDLQGVMLNEISQTEKSSTV